jgi:hypothetical protein
MEPLLIYTTNSGNGFAIEPVRNRTELIGREHAIQVVTFELLVEILREHFEKVGASRAT